MLEIGLKFVEPKSKSNCTSATNSNTNIMLRQIFANIRSTYFFDNGNIWEFNLSAMTALSRPLYVFLKAVILDALEKRSLLFAGTVIWCLDLHHFISQLVCFASRIFSVETSCDKRPSTRDSSIPPKKTSGKQHGVEDRDILKKICQ
jgi:hypothetical protein